MTVLSRRHAPKEAPPELLEAAEVADLAAYSTIAWPRAADATENAHRQCRASEWTMVQGSRSRFILTPGSASFVSQGDDGVNFRGAARGNVSREESDCREQRGHDDVGHGVGGLDAE